MLQVKELGERTVGEKVTTWDELGGETKLWGEILRLAMLAQDEHASAHAQLEGPCGGRTPVTKPGCPASASGMEKAHKRRTWLARTSVPTASESTIGRNLPQRDGGIVPNQ